MGPNVRKLIAHKMARDAIPDGGGLAAGIQFLSNPESVKRGAQEATQWVRDAIAVVKLSPDNPYGDDDEAIAGEIVRRIDEKDRQRGIPVF